MKFLREHRLKSGWTQAQVAEQLGVQPCTVTLWETGKREPNINMLRRLSDLFGCSVDGLLGGTQEPEEKQEPVGGSNMKIERINELKKQHGLTNAQLANLTGLTISTIDKLTSGYNSNPTLDTISKLADLFNCSVDYLLGRDESTINDDEAYKPERESRIRIIIDATPEEIAELFSRLKGGEVTSETSEDETSEDESSTGPSDVIAIRKNRQKFGLTQEGLAKILEVTKQAVSQWETGERKPDIVTLKHLAYIFGCTTDELLKDVDFRKGGTP